LEHVKLWANIKCAYDTKFDDGEIIAECDLWKKMHARSGTLSGGMKRKLQLAIMLVGGVEVCCMDEVSSGLVNTIKTSKSGNFQAD
jgi:ATP-binding cassette subfamily A (ABC1) protein 3